MPRMPYFFKAKNFMQGNLPSRVEFEPLSYANPILSLSSLDAQGIGLTKTTSVLRVDFFLSCFSTNVDTPLHEKSLCVMLFLQSGALVITFLSVVSSTFSLNFVPSE